MGEPQRNNLIWLVGALIASIAIVAIGTSLDLPDAFIAGPLLGLWMYVIYRNRQTWREHRGE